MNMKTPVITSSMRSAQSGFTLVELMIAVTIALFLVGGLVTLVDGMKRASLSQDGMSQLQDNERMAATLLTDVIQSAGYFPNPTATTAALTFPVVGPFTFAGQSIAGSGVGTAAPPGDTITVRYATGGTGAVPPDNTINCMGNTNATPTLFTNKLYMVTTAGVGYLVCSLNGAATPVQLASGITNLQIYYGVQSNPAALTNSVDAYVDATAVTDWSKVLSVKIILTFTNPMANQPGQLPTIQFTRVVDVMNKTGVST
jgi:type IV pilus assembly protein PilW